MDELDAGLKISVQGPAAEQALAKFHEQLEAWGLKMPPVEPLVLDFGLGDFDGTGLIEYWIANEAKAGYCGKYLYVHDGQTCPAHSHRAKMETFCVVKGRVRVDRPDGAVELAEGEVLPVPPGTVHSFTGLGNCLLLELSMPCEIDDNYFENRSIPIGGNQQA